MRRGGMNAVCHTLQILSLVGCEWVGSCSNHGYRAAECPGVNLDVYRIRPQSSTPTLANLFCCNLYVTFIQITRNASVLGLPECNFCCSPRIFFNSQELQFYKGIIYLYDLRSYVCYLHIFSPLSVHSYDLNHCSCMTGISAICTIKYVLMMLLA